MLKKLARRMVPERLWTTLRLWQYSRSLKRFKPRQVRHTYGGFTFDISLTDPTAESWYDIDWPEPTEIALLKSRRLKPGARVFDCGAHQCVVALILAKIVGPTGLVVAVEANAHNAAQGQRNRELNAASEMTVLNAAVAASPGTIALNHRLNGQIDDGKGEWGRMEVPAVSVDQLTRRFGVPDVLFIDVEGFEAQVLEGARETLAQRPDCFIEVHLGCGLEKFGGSVESLLKFFPPADYELMMAPPGSPQLGETSEFTPFSASSPIAKDRFFLAALVR